MRKTTFYNVTRFNVVQTNKQLINYKVVAMLQNTYSMTKLDEGIVLKINQSHEYLSLRSGLIFH